MTKQTEVVWGDTLILRYAIRLRNGTKIISNFDEPEADTLTLGDGTLIQTLEQWLIGLKPGERHVFLLDAWQAYGERNEALVQMLKHQDLPDNVPPMQRDQLIEFAMPNGQTLAGQVIDISPDGVKVDFNHPLADCPIEFEVEIESIKK
jgi:FKBP-type peptidyl-prolyl cis-trans isomerase 2